jgi:MFS family permease
LLLLSKGFAPKALAGFAFGFSLGCFVGKIACGRLIDRFGSRSTFIGAQLLLSLLIVLLLLGDSFYYVITISLFIGIVTKGSVPVVQTLATEYVARDFYDDIFSVNSFFRGIALIIIPLFFGFSASLYGIHSIYMIMAAVSITAVLPIVAIRLGSTPG